MRALEQLIGGFRGTLETFRVSDEYKRLLEIVIENDNKMMELLADSPELLAHYKATIDSIEKSRGELEIEQYLEGLRFGILLGIDICKDPEERE